MRRNEHIPIQNIYYMLAYAFCSLNQLDIKSVSAEEFPNVCDLLAAILCKGISCQLKRGLYREYVGYVEDLPALRGKLDIRGSIRNKMANHRELSCEYDELSEDILLNQILKTTAFLLIRSNDVKKDTKDILKKQMIFLEAVQMLEPKSIPWSSVRYHRNNQGYELLIGICRLIIDGMIFNEEEGWQKLAQFDEERAMSSLYEKFILEYYRREFARCLGADDIWIDWSEDDVENRKKLPGMHTDITLTHKDKATGEVKILIIDAKYYTRTMVTNQYGKKAMHSSNLYQLLAYVTNKKYQLEQAGKPNTVSGMLLYARTDEEVQPDSSHVIMGNRMEVKTLDLNQDFSEIRRQLDQIVEEYFGILSQ